MAQIFEEVGRANGRLKKNKQELNNYSRRYSPPYQPENIKRYRTPHSTSIPPALLLPQERDEQ